MRRALAVLLYLAIGLPLALGSLSLLSIRGWVVDPQFYHRAIDDPRLWSALKSRPASDIPEKVIIGGRSFEGRAFATAIQKNLPEAEIKRVADDAVDATLGELARKGDIEALDLLPFKKVMGATTQAVASDYVSTLPSEAKEPSLDDLSYRPAKTSPSLMTTQVKEALDQTIAKIPDTVRPEASTRETRAELSIQVSQSSLDRTTWGLTGAALALIAAAAALGGGSFGRILSRAGSFIVLPSVLTLVIGAFIAIPGGLLNAGLPVVIGDPDLRAFIEGASGEAIRGYLATVLGPIARGFVIAGLAGTSIGAVLVGAKKYIDASTLSEET